MEEIVFATNNLAKINQLKGALAHLKIKVIGIAKFGNIPDIAEDGKTAQDNARKKAMTYANILGRQVFAMDNALYFDGLPDNEQPGIHVRRIDNSNQRPSDEQLVEYYSNLFNKHGGRLTGRWEFAICLAMPDGKIFEDTIIVPRIFISKVSNKKIPGYPLESMQIDPDSGKYIAEMSQEEQDEFWQKKIGLPLKKFFEKI